MHVVESHLSALEHAGMRCLILILRKVIQNWGFFFFKWVLEVHGVSEPGKWSWLKPCCMFLTRLMVRAHWEWMLFHLEQQLSWCGISWCARNSFVSWVVFRKTKLKPSSILHACEMRWWVMPLSCCAATIKSADFKLISVQVNACNIPFYLCFCAFLDMATEQQLGEGTKFKIPAFCSSASFCDTGPSPTFLCLCVHTYLFQMILQYKPCILRVSIWSNDNLYTTGLGERGKTKIVTHFQSDMSSFASSPSYGRSPHDTASA